MRIKSLAVGMMACAALVACSNNDLVDESNGNQPLKNDAYVAVNIVVPNGSSARANESFEAGSDAENDIKSAMFLFFDQSGKGCADPILIAGDKLTPWTKANGSVDQISTPVLLLNPVEGTSPTSMVAILNPTEPYTINTTLAEVKAAANTTYGSTSSFLMSNSVYVNDGKVVTEIPLTLDNLATSTELAKANPVIVPVERVVAKVALTEGSKAVTSSGFSQTVDSKETKLKVVIKGWKATATNPSSYLIKHLNSTYNYTWQWNDADNTRSYWAESAAPEKYTYYSYDEAIANMSNDYEYCFENTSATPTQLLVVAQVQDEKGNPVELAEWMGVKYTKAGLKNYIANLLNKYYYLESGEAGKPGAVYKTLQPEHLDFTANNLAYKANIALAKDAPTTFYTVTGADNNGHVTGSVDATNDLKAEIAKMQPAKMWTGGDTYYYTNIEHVSGTDTTKPLAGIVRNHVYKLTIKSIAGLGTPVYDPNKKIIPEKPTDDNSYVAAQVEVLKWKVVSQTVDLK